MKNHSLREIVAAKHSVKRDFFIILLTIFTFGIGINSLLLHLGVLHPWVRALICQPLSYLFFFVVVKVWLNEFLPKIDLKQNENTLTPILIAKESQLERKRSGGLGGLPDLPDADIIWVLVFMLISFLVAIWILSEGPLVLVDSAFEAALSATLIKRAKRVISWEWHETLLQKTIGPFLGILLLTIVFSWNIENHCPGTTKISTALMKCGF